MNRSSTSGTDEIPPLSIGAVVGGSGPNETRWGDAAMRLSRRLRHLLQSLEARPNEVKINVIYHIAGEILGSTFSGVRTGHYSKRDGLLIVQASVPTTDSVGVEERVLVELFSQAVAAAEGYFKKRELAGHLTFHRDVAARLMGVVEDDPLTSQ